MHWPDSTVQQDIIKNQYSYYSCLDQISGLFNDLLEFWIAKCLLLRKARTIPVAPIQYDQFKLCEVGQDPPEKGNSDMSHWQIIPIPIIHVGLGDKPTS